MRKKPQPQQPTVTPTAAFAVTLSPRGAARVKAGHPWVYRSDIEAADDVALGAVVRVADQRGKTLGAALYSSASQIAIRMIARSTTANPEAAVTDLPSLVAERIRAAIAYRERVVEGSDAYRVVFSEADFLPGLIIDRYNDVLSVQILTQAMDSEEVRRAVIATLVEQFQPAGIVERVDPRIRELEQLPARESGMMWGKKSSTIITMNANLDGRGRPSLHHFRAVAAPQGEAPKGGGERDGVSFHYDGLEGQKTGAFLDQRENYAAAARYARGNALDVFCYQGGFALHLAAKCASVTGVDSSRPALEMAEKNAALNFPGREFEWIEANAFDLLRDYAAAGRQDDRKTAGAKYDIVVLDPPAFAKTKRDIEKALRGYKELNLRALRMLKPGGILVTCSCSFHVSAADFLEVVAAAGHDAHRSLRILENRAQAKDHPVLLNAPETGYLKCIILNVSN